ncbi:MAG TPA: response regulator transcription factor [Polyangiaceae bacterium]
MTLPAAIRIAFVDDHPIYCEGLRSVVHSDPRLELVGEAGDAREGLALARRVRPEVLLTDIGLKGGHTGIDLTRALVQQVEHTRVLMLSVQTAASYVKRAYGAGARGYVSKADPPAALLAAIQAVALGGTFWPPGIDLGVSRDVLTPKELEVARHLAQGFRNSQIAALMGSSKRTVEGHRRQTYAKLGVGTVIGIREWLDEHGLLEPESGLVEL